MLHTWEGSQHWDEALQLLRSMLHYFLTPDVYSYSAILNAYKVNQHWKEAFHLLP